MVREEYKAKLDSLGDQMDDPDARAELFRPQIEWYRERLQSNISETRKSGKFDLTIGHYAKMATNNVWFFPSFSLYIRDYNSLISCSQLRSTKSQVSFSSVILSTRQEMPMVPIPV